MGEGDESERTGGIILDGCWGTEVILGVMGRSFVAGLVSNNCRETVVLEKPNG